jgi:hypothetical protein
MLESAALLRRQFWHRCWNQQQMLILQTGIMHNVIMYALYFNNCEWALFVAADSMVKLLTKLLTKLANT